MHLILNGGSGFLLRSTCTMQGLCVHVRNVPGSGLESESHSFIRKSVTRPPRQVQRPGLPGMTAEVLRRQGTAVEHWRTGISEDVPAQAVFARVAQENSRMASEPRAISKGRQPSRGNDALLLDVPPPVAEPFAEDGLYGEVDESFGSINSEYQECYSEGAAFAA